VATGSYRGTGTEDIKQLRGIISEVRGALLASRIEALARSISSSKTADRKEESVALVLDWWEVPSMAQTEFDGEERGGLSHGEKWVVWSSGERVELHKCQEVCPQRGAAETVHRLSGERRYRDGSPEGGGYPAPLTSPVFQYRTTTNPLCGSKMAPSG
jgi:hypothetical protein